MPLLRSSEETVLSSSPDLLELLPPPLEPLRRDDLPSPTEYPQLYETGGHCAQGQVTCYECQRDRAGHYLACTTCFVPICVKCALDLDFDKTEGVCSQCSGEHLKSVWLHRFNKEDNCVELCCEFIGNSESVWIDASEFHNQYPEAFYQYLTNGHYSHTQ